MPNWDGARAEMLLDPTVINLNTGSFGPLPKAVFERVTELRRHQAAEPMDFIVRATPPLLWKARSVLADFLGTAANRLLFTQNVTAAVNMIASGLRLEAPGEILISDREYAPMHWCWDRAARRQGLVLKTFALPLMPRSPDEIFDVIKAAITPQTRLLFFSHIYAATGLVVPARNLCNLARRRGIISVVDGAHAPAQIALAVDEIDADFYAGNLHKWLLAPLGSGFLVLGRESLDRLEPLQVSWGYGQPMNRPDEPDEFGSTPRLRELEFEGTRDVCPWLVVPEAIAFQNQLGFAEIRSRMAELSLYARERLDGRGVLRLTTPTDPGMHAAMTAYWAPTTLPAAEVRRRLWEHRTEVPVTDWSDGRILRVSGHFYTTEWEIDRFAESAPAILG